MIDAHDALARRLARPARAWHKSGAVLAYENTAAETTAGVYRSGREWVWVVTQFGREVAAGREIRQADAKVQADAQLDACHEAAGVRA